LGVIHHDLFHRGLSLTSSELSEVYDLLGSLDWSRNNREWVDEAHLGTWTTPRGGKEEQVVIVGAGRTNTQAIIDFLRIRTGLQARLETARQAAA
jgi:hypothetical protein